MTMSTAAAISGGTSSSLAWVDTAGKVRARGDNRAECLQHRSSGAADGRDPQADRVRPLRVEPGVPARGVLEDQRERPREQRPRDLDGSHGKLGHALEQDVDGCEEHRRRLDRVTALRGVERPSSRLALAVRGEPVHGVGGQDDEPSGPQRSDGSVDTHVGVRPSTTRSRPARSFVVRYGDVALSVEQGGDTGCAVLVRLDRKRAARPEGPTRVPDERLGLPPVEERQLGLPVDDFGREGRELVVAHVGWVRDDEVPSRRPADRRRGRGTGARRRGL